jgi:hypothetical protein
VTSTSVAAVAVGVSAFAIAYLAPMTSGKGLEMDEGAVVAYADRVLEGAVPHRDFLTFYGPANPWIVAGAFKLFGQGFGTERAVGLVYRLVIVASLLLIGMRLSGIVGGALGGIVATVLMGKELIWAYATYGALAFGLVGIALTVWAATANDRRRHLQLAGLFAGGVAGGVAVLIRFDFALAVGLAAVPLVTLVPGRRRWWYVSGLVAAMAVCAVHLALVGPERIARVASDLVASGPGRRLPRPPLTDYPGTLLAVSVLVLVLFVAVGGLLWRRRTHEPVPQLLVSLGLFGLALLPYVLSRADAGHIQVLAIVPLSLLPALILLGVAFVSRERLRQCLVGAVATGTLALVVHDGDFSVDRARGLKNVRSAPRVVDDDDSREATRLVIARLRASARPGDTLFVGPLDLRRTNYGPTYLYPVLDEFEPASYYMEMNPGTANRRDSGLADELRRADWLVLTSEWDDWNEPNESTEPGSSEPTEVVRDDFCLRLEHGTFRLYERCDRAA